MKDLFIDEMANNPPFPINPLFNSGPMRMPFPGGFPPGLPPMIPPSNFDLKFFQFLEIIILNLFLFNSKDGVPPVMPLNQPVASVSIV